MEEEEEEVVGGVVSFSSLVGLARSFISYRPGERKVKKKRRKGEEEKRRGEDGQRGRSVDGW